MNTNAIIMKLNAKNNGQFFKISWMSDVPITASAKAHGQVVYKYTTGTVRKGINYANQKSVQMKVQNEGKVLTHESRKPYLDKALSVLEFKSTKEFFEHVKTGK